MTISPLHPETLAALRELIGDVPPASDRTVADIATTVAQRRDHDHHAGGNEDLFCSNLAGWAGERAGHLISRLIVEGERIEDRRARLVALDTDAQNIRGLLAPNGAPRLVPMELGEQLLPAVQWLTEQLGTKLAYRAQFDSMTLGVYTTLTAAQEHCEDDVAAHVDLEERILRWVPVDEEAGTDPVRAESELYTFLSDEPGEATSYVISPFELLTAYDPTAEG
ncbi:hypothetical protein ACEZCY_14065 [Streptacidiphilus sp. N1-12]|uniref:Uncharacterized protein n=2 Tax=Streptacidiphilus alkalitolerans TaxID=3342712 RepID=A0ABV6WE73_9ACTN